MLILKFDISQHSDSYFNSHFSHLSRLSTCP